MPTRRLLIDIEVAVSDDPISEHVKALLLAHVARIDAGRDIGSCGEETVPEVPGRLRWRSLDA